MSTEINTTIYGVRNIRYLRGDDLLPINITFKSRSSSSDPYLPIDLTGSTFSMKVIALGDASKTAIVSFSVGSGITLDATNGKITIAKTALQMAALSAGEYLYDIQQTNSANQIKTWLRGYFIVEDDVTIP